MAADANRPLETTTPVDALDLLQQDHRAVEALFETFEATEDKRAQRRIAQRICAELHVHAQIEEKILYPEAKRRRELRDLINEGIVEHQALKKLIRDIRKLSASDEFFAPKVKVLKEFVEHHVEEEESEAFPKIRECGLDLDQIGRRLAERKQRLVASNS